MNWIVVALIKGVVLAFFAISCARDLDRYIFSEERDRFDLAGAIGWFGGIIMLSQGF